MFSDKADGFVSIGEVIPDLILEIRYYSTFNFIGDRIDGYEQPVALLTREAASRLKEVSVDLAREGFRRIFTTPTVHRRQWIISCAGRRIYLTRA